MKKFLLSVLIVGVVGAWVCRGRLFAAMPPVVISGSHVLVGQSPGDHALYAFNAACEIRAASVGYEFDSSNMGEWLPELGARGIVSFMDDKKFQAIHLAATRTGTCMANYLNECQQRGEIQHLILVPKDSAALEQMRGASIADGRGFHMKGRYLAFEEGSVDGHSFNGRMTGTGYFFVESIGGNE